MPWVMVMSEAESADDGPAHPLSKDFEDMTRAQLRGYIAREAGKRTNWDTPFDRDTLNSIYAHFTGSYYVPKRVLHKPHHPDWAPRKDILHGVVMETPIGEPEDEWGTPGSIPDQLRRDELQTLAEAIDEQENKLLAGDDDG